MSDLFMLEGGTPMTYAMLDERVTRMRLALAPRMAASGVVAISATNRPATVVALVALMEAGATFVPLHPRLTPHERDALVRAAGATTLLDDDALDALFHATPLEDTSLEDAPPRDFTAVLFTSGTSGTPRGAILPRAAFDASAAASTANLGWREDDRWLACMPLCHVGGLSILTRCLRARRALVLHPRFDADAVLESIARDAVTLLSVVPTMLADLLRADRHNALASLRAMLVGGAAASPALLEECQARGIRALATYGLTEACSQVASQRLDEPAAAHGVGRALPGVEVDVVDGRVHVRGQTRMRGYLGEPPLAPSTWFDTGDLGELDERGTLFVHARRSDLIVSGGENVYPREVELALEACPGVRRANVVGVPDARWGLAVTAMVEMSEGTAPNERMLHDALARTLAAFKRPKRIAFTDAWPLLAASKVDRRQVARMLTPE